MKFLDTMLIILGLIGIALLFLSVWFAIVIETEDIQDITLKFNLLTFMTGLAYILFIIVILKLKKK